MLRFLIAGIVGGALVFGAGAFNHMVLKLEGRQFDRLPEEAKFREYFDKKGVPAGIYNFPTLPEGFDGLSKEDQEKEWARVNELYKSGPAAFIVVAPGGDDMMGPPQLGGEFATNVLAALIAAFILCRTSPDSGYFLRLLIVVLLGLFTWLSTSASYALWYRFPWPYILDGLYCSLIEWGVAGIVMAAIARPPAAATPPKS